MAVQNIKHMIETLILGIIIGIVGTGIGATYAANKFLKEPWILKKFNSGYQILASDLGYDGDTYGYIGLKKNNELIMGIKYNEKGVTDIVYDI